MASTDYAGTWEYKGTVIPNWSMDWDEGDRFPFATQSGNPIIRLQYYGEKPTKSKAYIRQALDMGDFIFTPWRRIFYSEKKQLINLATPPEILINAAVVRWFEVCKVPRYYNIGTTTEPSWGVGLEVLEEAALSPEILSLVSGTPTKVINAGNSGNIVVVVS